MAAESKNTKQVMDVAKPGKTPAEASGRPIIVGHKPEVQDPMVHAGEEKNPDAVEEPKETKLSSSGKKVISPVTIQPDEAKDQEAAVSDEVKDETDKSTEAPQDNDDQIGDEGLKNEEEDELKKQQEKIDALVSQKKYFVPIGKVRRRKSRMTALLVLFIVCGLLAITIIAIDAEMIDVGFTLPFEIMPE